MVTPLHVPSQEAQKALGDAKRDIKQTSKELNAQLAEMEESLSNQLRRAERENSTVYLMRVPNIADLPVIQPHSVAKCAQSFAPYKAAISCRTSMRTWSREVHIVALAEMQQRNLSAYSRSLDASSIGALLDFQA